MAEELRECVCACEVEEGWGINATLSQPEWLHCEPTDVQQVELFNCEVQGHQIVSTKSPDCVHKVTRLCPQVTRLCPQSHQTVSTKSPDCDHKVTRLCPQVTRLCPRVTRLCPQSHQTVSTKSPDCVHVSPGWVHKVTRLCPQSHQTVSTRHDLLPEGTEGRSRIKPRSFWQRPSALPLGQTGLRLKTVPLVHLLNAQLSRSRPVERSQIPRVSHPGYTTRMPLIKIRVAAWAMLMFHSLWAGVDKWVTTSLQWPYPVTSEERVQPKWNRTEDPPLASILPYR